MPQLPTPHVPSDPLETAPVEPPRFASSQASLYLDMLRGLAAVVVLLGHMRFILFQDLSLLPAHRALFTVPYIVLSTGHQAVIVFFVLSGYLISGSIFRQLDAGLWSWPSYLLHRIARLWVVLIPTLLAGIVWDYFGLHLRRPGAVLLYGGLSGDHAVNTDIHLSYNAASWFGTLFFLHGSWTSAFGSSGQLWSLANEFWYYLIFPLGLFALLRTSSTGKRICSAALCIAAMCFISRDILILFPVWLMGTALAKLPRRVLPGRMRLVATLCWLPCIVGSTALSRIGYPVLSDFVFGVVTMGYLWVLLSAFQHTAKKSAATHAWRTLARFSYTLYAVHVSPLLLVGGLTLGLVRWNTDVPHLALGFVIFCGIMLYAFGMATVTEFRTDDVRHWIEKKLPWTAPRTRPH
jgi:peptidoglycan/LPS O-acetylase OafA/YrhL